MPNSTKIQILAINITKISEEQHVEIEYDIDANFSHYPQLIGEGFLRIIKDLIIVKGVTKIPNVLSPPNAEPI